MTALGEDCSICGEQIEKRDIALLRRHNGKRGWCHLACSVHGLERWDREGRPYETPLEWDREERPKWWWTHHMGTVWNHRTEGNRVSHDTSRYTNY